MLPDATSTYEGWSDDWRPVVGFEGLYEVDSAGNIRRIGKAATHGAGRGGGARIGRILASQKSNTGYLAVQLWKEGRCCTRQVHIVVADAFLGLRPPGLVVNHKDGNKHNPHLTNLEYVTVGENNRHAYATGLKRSNKGGTTSKRKPRIDIPCHCGCGTLLTTPDPKGRTRRFISGHNMCTPQERRQDHRTALA